MKTKVRETSIEAYKRLIDEDKLQPKEKELLQALVHIQPACDRELARYLGWEINSVNGRRNSLASKNRIVEAYKHVSTTGRKVIFWKLNLKQERLFEDVA